jgi:ABC-type branched-subunit amino acid transport system substrate-binding protein
MAVALLGLTGCSMVGDALGGEQDTGPRGAKIVVLVPGDGNQVAAGQGVHAAVELALREAALAIPGWSVEVVAVDEPRDDAEAARVAEELADDDEVVAVVGGLAAALRAVQPVLDRASIVFVSPADVTPEHTRGADPAEPLRPYDTYFRTAVPGGDPVAAAAEYAVRGLNAARVAVIDGGVGDEAARFGTEVAGLGGDVVASAAAGPDRAGVDAVIAGAVERGAGAVYVAGDAALAAEAAKKLAGTGLDARLLGGADLRSEDFLAAAGTAADGAVAVVAGTVEPSAASDVDDLTARLDAKSLPPPGPYGAAAYDAGTALAQVLSRCLPPEDSAARARAGCVGEMEQVSFPGLTGQVDFDRFGERTGGHPVAFEVRDGGWVEIGGGA